MTGENLVTGATLSDAERGIAALNVMLLGGCSTATRGITALGKLGRVVAGVRGQAIVNLATEVAQKWPTKVIDQILEWNSKGLGRIGDEFVASRLTAPCAKFLWARRTVAMRESCPGTSPKH